MANVDGYLIYGGKYGEEMIKLAELPAKTTRYTVKNLKQGTSENAPPIVDYIYLSIYYRGSISKSMDLRERSEYHILFYHKLKYYCLCLFAV